MARCDEREPQTLCVDGVVVVGLAGQQAIRTPCNGVLEEASACAADDGQPPHCFAGVGELDLHRRAVERLIAPGGKLFLRLFCQLGDCDGLDAAHTTAAFGERFHLPHPKDTGQHLIDAALGGIEIRMHTNRRDAAFHQLEGHVLPTQLFEGREDDRVMGHDEPAALPGGLFHHLGGDVQRHQHTGHLAAAVYQQARIVPAFGQSQRRDALHLFVYLLYRRHALLSPFISSSISFASSVPSGTPRRRRGSLAFCHAA